MDVLHHVYLFKVDGNDLGSGRGGKSESGRNRVHDVDFLGSFEKGESGCALLRLAMSMEDLLR
jgi:hypothetical protein